MVIIMVVCGQSLVKSDLQSVCRQHSMSQFYMAVEGGATLFSSKNAVWKA